MSRLHPTGTPDGLDRWRSGTGDKALFTPGPLTTSPGVKQAMLRDLGSRDSEFLEVVRDVRKELLELGGVGDKGYEAILMQGSGTFGIESVISSTVPENGRMLVVANGVYGRRMVQIASVLGIGTTVLEYAEDSIPSPRDVDRALEEDPGITHVAAVHCETTTGILNPVEEIGEVVRRHDRLYFVDAMSSFGAIPLDLTSCGIDFLVSSANKCIEGVPGFSFVLARREALLSARGCARSVSLDLLGQWEGLESNGQFRFTPPTHAILAFRQALRELEQEGGIEGRAQRYRRNHELLTAGMKKLGFRQYLNPELQSFIITSYLYPKHPRFLFETFYSLLNDKGYVIYPGKLTTGDCFRVGTIGRIGETEIHGLLDAIRAVLSDLDITLAPADGAE